MLPCLRHRGSLPRGRYVLAPLAGTKEGSSCLMVLRVKPTPTRFPATSLSTPMDNTPLHSVSSVFHPRGVAVQETCTFALFRCSGNDICLRLESIADNKHQKSPLGSQWRMPEEFQEMLKKGLRPYLFAQFLRPKCVYVNLSPYRLYDR